MASQLSAVPVESRRRIAATVGLFAVLFVAIGAVAVTGSGLTVVLGVIALAVAVVLALVAWGMVRTITMDRAEEQLDEVLESAMQAHGGYESMCGCGHEHDPGELHITDADEHTHSDTCSHDGSGAACAHNCDTCVLAALRA